MKPLNKIVILKRETAEMNKTKSGLFIGADNTFNQTGIVHAVAENEDVKVGDKVLMKKHKGEELVLEGVSYISCQLEDLIAVIYDNNTP